MASSTASLIWSHILSGCPSVTDSLVKSREGALIKVVLIKVAPSSHMFLLRTVWVSKQ
jgi:hypothetical protein